MPAPLLRIPCFLPRSYLQSQFPPLRTFFFQPDILQTGPLDDEALIAAQTADIIALRNKVNDEALLRILSRLRGGIPCELDTFDPLGQSHIRAMYIHLRICFSDGVVWLARLPRESVNSFSTRLTSDIMESECATLKFLEGLDLPTPTLHGYGLWKDPKNEVGVAYMLIDELRGTPLLQRNPTPDQLRKFYNQWADILVRLSRHPFTKAGPLTMRFGGVEISGIVGDRNPIILLMHSFSNARKLYAAFSEHFLKLISTGQLYSKHPVDAHLVFKYLKELAEKGRWNAFESVWDDGPFYLKHTDDKGDHILVDDDYKITGVIDWTFARVVPAFEAFGPSLLTADKGALFTGKPGPSSNDEMMSDILKSKDS